MTDDTRTPLLTAIEGYEASCTRNGDLADERVQSLNYYLGKPFGNEVEGRSQVVSRDVADTIEWIKPSLMRIFASGDEIVAFNPKGEEDVEAAQQESDFANYVLTQKNNWFRTSYVWFTDALMQKNAYVKAWYEEKEDVTKETYEGLTQDALAMIAQDPEVEIVSQEQYPDPSIHPEMAQQMMMAGQQPPMLIRAVLKRTGTYGCVKYKEIPPERCLVSQWASSIDLEDVDFFEHFEWQTASEIKANGLELPENIGDEHETAFTDTEEQARDLYGEPWVDSETNDPSTKRYKVREVWVRFDDDGDGIAELLHVIVVGRHELLKEECEFIPAAAITPKMMPHRHVGRSVSDDIMDLQLIKSTLLRGTLDNMYLANNGRYGVDEKKVNLDDMLTSRPGGIVRTDGPPGDKILPFEHPNMMGEGLKAIEYIDNIKQNRTGVTAYVTSVDENVLNKTASGTNMLQNAAMAKIELIARVFAETGVKRLMWLIHALSLKHARKAEMVRLRNKWVEVDPRQWVKRYDMTVSVGLGTGNREQQKMDLQMILALQEKTLPMGLTTLKNAHHALVKFTQACGFKDDESFFTEPQEGAQMPSPPDPMQAEQLKAETALKTEALKQQAETDRKKMDIASNEQIEATKIAADVDKTKFQAHTQREGKQMEIESKGAVEREKIAASQKPTANVQIDGKEHLEQMAETISQAAQILVQGQAQLAQMMQALAQNATAEKELYVDKKTGNKRVRMIPQEVQ